MKLPPPLPPGRSSSWVTAGLFRAEAEIAVRRLKSWRRKSEELFTKLGPHRKFTPEESRRVRRTMEMTRLYACATIAFSAMSVESFLNLYAVRRFGATVAGRDFERASIEQKVRMLLEACVERTPSHDDEFHRRLRRLVARRNELVHPKTKEVETGKEHLEFEHPPAVAEEAFSDMEYFFSRYETLDPDARPYTR